MSRRSHVKTLFHIIERKPVQVDRVALLDAHLLELFKKPGLLQRALEVHARLVIVEVDRPHQPLEPDALGDVHPVVHLDLRALDVLARDLRRDVFRLVHLHGRQLLQKLPRLVHQLAHTLARRGGDLHEFHALRLDMRAQRVDQRAVLDDVGLVRSNDLRTRSERGVVAPELLVDRLEILHRVAPLRAGCVDEVDVHPHFSTKTLSIANCPEDELGQGYEYLIKKFADDSGHTAQEFYTNRTVVHLMTEMLKPESGESIYDPTCGSAGMLISAIAYLKEKNKEWRNVAVYGQEINALTSSIGKMNLFLHGVKDFSIVNGDTLKAPAFVENGRLQQFDLCLANPPYSISQWDRAAFESDKYGRNFLGVPPQGRADYAFLQHIIASLKEDTGRCAILFPHGVLFRNEECSMREKLIRSDKVECVIGLGANLFYNSPMEACIMICRMTKRPDRRGQVLFINAVNEVERRNAQSYLEDRHIARIAAAYDNYTDNSGFAKVATIQDIADNNFSLSIPLYVKPEIGDNEVDGRTVQECYDSWLAASEMMKLSYEKLNTLLGKGADDNG